ncbi:FAD-binding protein, partial [Escherichia coli]|uniref:FAD-binding protein n=1 Tax=Escherichia coli TaxID=562 RepID=UPI003D7671F7
MDHHQAGSPQRLCARITRPIDQYSNSRRQRDMNKTLDADLIIVGCGVAGLSAAVTALEQGLKVINLERSGEDHFGGNSRWTEAYMRM